MKFRVGSPVFCLRFGHGAAHHHRLVFLGIWLQKPLGADDQGASVKAFPVDANDTVDVLNGFWRCPPKF